MPTPTASLPPSPTPEPQNRKTATLSIEAESTIQTVNYTLTVKGRLWAPETIGIAVQDILVSYQLTGESTWTLIGSPMTNEWGKYDFRWTPPLGTFVLKAEWAGNSEYYPASNSTTVGTIAIQDQIGVIMSNSTITQVTYNQTVGLCFTLNGEAGTPGYTSVFMPKSVMPDQNINVHVDGKPVNFDLTAKDDAWIISFTYQHSTHQVIINSATNNPQDGTLILDEGMLLILAAVIATLTAAAGLIIWLAKTKKK
jgi:hypothetical protein